MTYEWLRRNAYRFDKKHDAISGQSKRNPTLDQAFITGVKDRIRSGGHLSKQEQASYLQAAKREARYATN